MSRRRVIGIALGAAAAVLLAVAIGLWVAQDGADEEVSTAPSDTTTGSTTVDTAARGSASTVPTATAADDLETFFSAVDDVDGRIVTAAALINDRVTDTGFDIDQPTADAVTAAWNGVAELEATVPPGLEPDLLQAVLLVEGDLVSRAAALRPASTVGPLVPSQIEHCLRNGAAAAERFPDDLAALRTLAATSPPVGAVEPDSRQAEELAVRLAQIRLMNTGCEACGGYRAEELTAVRFYDDPVPDPATGEVVTGAIQAPGGGDVPFESSYDPTAGWTVVIHAC